MNGRLNETFPLRVDSMVSRCGVSACGTTGVAGLIGLECTRRICVHDSGASDFTAFTRQPWHATPTKSSYRGAVPSTGKRSVRAISCFHATTVAYHTNKI